MSREAKPAGGQLGSETVDRAKAIEGSVISVEVLGPVSQGDSPLVLGNLGWPPRLSGILMLSESWGAGIKLG